MARNTSPSTLHRGPKPTYGLYGRRLLCFSYISWKTATAQVLYEERSGLEMKENGDLCGRWLCKNGNPDEAWRTGPLSWANRGIEIKSRNQKEPFFRGEGEHRVCRRFLNSLGLVLDQGWRSQAPASLSLWHGVVHCWLSSGSTNNRGALDYSSRSESEPAVTFPEVWALGNGYVFQSLSFPTHKIEIILVSTSSIQITHVELLRESLTQSEDVTNACWFYCSLPLP